jgi:hypothetical protein
MVSPQNPVSPNIGSGTVTAPRGFVGEELTSISGPVYGQSAQLAYRGRNYFWGAVIAGTLFVLSLFVLSWFLMLGCHVGVARDGVIALHGGSAAWLIITSCIAFYFGGMIAGRISGPDSNGWLRGITVWGLSIPLTLCIWGLVAGGIGLLSAAAPHVNVVEQVNHAQAIGGYGVYNFVPFGAVWAAFVGLACGLVFATIGSSMFGGTGTWLSGDSRLS